MTSAWARTSASWRRSSAIELAKERKLVADDVEHPDAHALVGSDSSESEGEKA